jgi:hypothetical protein
MVGMTSRTTLGALAVAAALAVSLSACGGGGGGSGRSSSSPSSSTASPSPAAASGGRASAVSGGVHAVLHARNHDPRVGKPWPYTVRVTGSGGRPLAGKVDVEFVLGQLVVGHDRPPVHTLRHGLVRENLTFPAAAVGHPISLQAVVHAGGGTLTLDWPLHVVR